MPIKSSLLPPNKEAALVVNVPEYVVTTGASSLEPKTDNCWRYRRVVPYSNLLPSVRSSGTTTTLARRSSLLCRRNSSTCTIPQLFELVDTQAKPTTPPNIFSMAPLLVLAAWVGGWGGRTLPSRMMLTLELELRSLNHPSLFVWIGPS